MATTEDPILAKVRRATFHFDEDGMAIRQMERRLAETGRRESVITYSELIRGIQFHLPSVQGGRAVELGVPEWIDLHRAIIGGCLGRISCNSYEAGRFLASALAVSRATYEPSDGFASLLEDFGIVRSRRSEECTTVWIEELRKAYTWLREHPSWPD